MAQPCMLCPHSGYNNGMKAIIQQKIKEAMLAKDTQALGVFRAINAAFLNFEKEKVGNEVDDEVGTRLIRKLVKQGRDSADVYAQNGRQDAADKELAEVAIMETLLPQNVGPEELEKAVQDLIAANGYTKKDFGAVMKAILGAYPGRVDGKDVKAVAERLLG